jgi:UDP-N-acetylglucosamine acyltransferase
VTQVHPTAIVDPRAELGEGAEVGAYAVVGADVRIGAGSRVMPHAVLDGVTTLGSRCTVFPFASVGSRSQDLKFRGACTRVEIGDGTTIREFVTVNAGTSEGESTTIGRNCLIMAYAHVAHTCTVGDDVIMANCATLGGHIVVEDQAIIGGLSAVHQFCRIGRLAMVGGCTKVTKDCPPFLLVDGHPASVHGINRVGLERRGFSPETRRTLKQAYRLLCRARLSTRQALARIEETLQPCPELDHLLAFIRQSKRGVIK